MLSEPTCADLRSHDAQCNHIEALVAHSLQVTVTDSVNRLLNMIGGAFRDGATPEHAHAMSDQPHYVLLRKEYYTLSVGYSSQTMAERKCKDHDSRSHRPSLMQLMASWAI